MKILQVNKYFYRKGGSEAYLFSLIEGLKEHGVGVAEFAMQDPNNYESNWSKLFVSKVDYETRNIWDKMRFALKIIYSYEAKYKISRLLDIYKPDIVHLHIFQHQLSASILPEIKKRNIPVIYTAHDLKSICPNYKMLSHGRICEDCRGHKYYNCFKNSCVKDSSIKSLVNVVEMYFHLWRKYYDLIDFVITPSDFYRKKLVEFRYPASKVVHVPNFVDETEYIPTYYNRGYFIYFGRLSEEKGILTLIESMRSVSNGKLVVIGTGPLEETIKKRINELKIKNVELSGFRSGEDLISLIQNSMFSIMPSEWYENGPISLLESFACGKPVIGANIGGIPEHINEGEDGLIFEANNAIDLSDKINNLLEDPQAIVRMGKNARHKVEEKYSKDVHFNELISIYNSVLS